MRDLKTYKWVVVIFCYYIYPFVINDASVVSYTITYGIPLIYIILNYDLSIKFIGKMKKSQFLCLMLVFVLIFLSILYPTIHQTYDYTYISAATFIFRKLLIYIFLCEVIIKKYKGKSVPEIFIYYFCLATFIYVCSTLLFLSFEPLKAFWMQHVNNEGMRELYNYKYGYVTRTGWQGFSGFRNTLRCSISVVFLIYLYYEKQAINNINFGILFVFTFIGNMFYGRSGVAVSVVCIFIAILYYKLIRITAIIKWILGIGIVLLIINGLRSLNTRLNNWYVWMTTPFVNLIKTGTFNNVSVDNLLENMIFVPKFKTIILGDGRYSVNNAYYMHTDSGFMRQLLFWGLPGTVLSYYATFLSMKHFLHTKMFLLILVVFSIFEFKGEVYYEFVPLLLSLSFLKNWQENMKEND